MAPWRRTWGRSCPTRTETRRREATSEDSYGQARERGACALLHGCTLGARWDGGGGGLCSWRHWEA